MLSRTQCSKSTLDYEIKIRFITCFCPLGNSCSLLQLNHWTTCCHFVFPWNIIHILCSNHILCVMYPIWLLSTCTCKHMRLIVDPSNIDTAMSFVVFDSSTFKCWPINEGNKEKLQSPMNASKTITNHPLIWLGSYRFHSRYTNVYNLSIHRMHPSTLSSVLRLHLQYRIFLKP